MGRNDVNRGLKPIDQLKHPWVFWCKWAAGQDLQYDVGEQPFSSWYGFMWDGRKRGFHNIGLALPLWQPLALFGVLPVARLTRGTVNLLTGKRRSAAA